MPLIQVMSITNVESDVTLKDGSSIHIRHVRPQDDRLLVRVFEQCSPWTIYQRFLTTLPELSPEMARYLADVDNRSRAAVIAETATGPIGVARYEPTGDTGRVELGLIVVDAWQDRGLGRLLLREVFRAAQANGIHRFCAHVLGENRRMLHLLATEGQIQDWSTEAGMTTLSLTARPY